MTFIFSTWRPSPCSVCGPFPGGEDTVTVLYCTVLYCTVLLAKLELYFLLSRMTSFTDKIKIPSVLSRMFQGAILSILCNLRLYRVIANLKYTPDIINKTGVAGAVLQTAL